MLTTKPNATTQETLDRILGQLEGVCERDGQYSACCPAHDDTKQSFSLKLTADGVILMHCHAGCSKNALLQALDLDYCDLFPEKPKAAEKPDKLGPIVARYLYTDERGMPRFSATRHEPKDFRQWRPDGNGGWIPGLDGTQPVLYHLPDVIGAANGQAVFVCEGEKSTDAIRGLGAIGTCNAMGADGWRPEYTETLRGKNVAILPDIDAAGLKHAYHVAHELYGIAARVRVLELPGLPHKGDPFDWVQNGGDLPTLLGLLRETPNFDPNPTKSRGSNWARLADAIGPISWDWEPWLARAILTLLVSEPGVGKSAVALRIGACFLRGSTWPDGTAYTGERGAIIWGEAEAAQAINLERAKQWGLPLDRILTPLNPLIDIRLDDADHQGAIADLAKREDVRLIVVDSLRGAHSRDENSSEAIALVQWLAMLARDTGKPIILTHHLRKRGLLDGDRITLDRVRGSSAIVQMARVVWAMDTPDPRDSDTKRLSVIKSNLARFPAPVGVRIDEHGVTFTDAPEAPQHEPKQDQAADLLLALLGKGPVPAGKVKEEVEAAHVSWYAAKRAKERLGIESVKDGGQWFWTLNTNTE